jgi:hypothetical protein
MEENNNELIRKYTDIGVNPEKIWVTKNPSVCLWSISRRCLVGSVGEPDQVELITDKNGSRLSYENNKMVTLSVNTRNGIDVDAINASDGIIVTDATYNENNFRFGYVPKNLDVFDLK